MKRILVLSSAESEFTIDANRQFVEHVEAEMTDAAVDSCHYRDISFYITQGHITAKRISVDLELNAYDLVYFKSFYRYSEIASAVSCYLKQKNVRYICSEIDQAISYSKLTQYARLSSCDLPIIPTVFVEKTNWEAGVNLITSTFGFPCVFKAIDAKGGDANYLVGSVSMLQDIVNKHDSDFVAQQFIPNDYDMRIIIANNEVGCVIKRQRTSGDTHLNNTSKGASSELMAIDQLGHTIIDVAKRAATEFSREIAGVDIMINKSNGEPVILEVNASPQVATGAFVDNKIALYAKAFQALLNE